MVGLLSLLTTKVTACSSTPLGATYDVGDRPPIADSLQWRPRCLATLTVYFVCVSDVSGGFETRGVVGSECLRLLYVLSRLFEVLSIWAIV
jgi:hypothetical protein